MLVKTSELQGAALDWAVAKCEGFKPHAAASLVIMGEYSPSSNWCHGGPIIEREKINLSQGGGGQAAAFLHVPERPIEWVYGPSPLIAAMRCYIASKLGDDVHIPEGL